MQGILYGAAGDFLRMHEAKMSHNREQASRQNRHKALEDKKGTISFADMLTESMQELSVMA